MPTKKIYTNTLAQLAGKLATALISIFLIKIISSYLDLAGYGMYSKIYNYLSIFAVLADLGLYTISVREMSQLQNEPKKLEKFSGTILSLRAVSGGIIIFLSLFIALFLEGYNSPSALLSIFIVSIFTFFGLINSSIMSYLQAILKTEFSFIANTSGKLLTFILICIITFVILPEGKNNSDFGLILILLSGLLGNILMTILTWGYARKFQKIRFYWEKEIVIKILKSSIPYGIALFLGVIFFKIDTFLLSLMEPKHLSDQIVSLYSVPMKIVEVGMMYGTIFLNSFLPVLTTAIQEKNEQTTKQLTSKGFELLMGFGAGISVFIILFSEPIIRFISDEKFIENKIYEANSAHVMQIVSVVFLFYFISSLANYILIAKNEQKKIIFVNLFIAIFNIIGNLLIIPHYHFIGASIITAISQILLVIISLFLIRDTLQIKNIFIKSFTLISFAIISGGITFFSISLLHISSIFFLLTIASAIFGISYLSFWFGLTQLQKKFH